MSWPFRGGHDDELVVDIQRIVPRGLPEAIRQEVCQELALVALEHGGSVTNEMAKECLRRVRQMYPSMSTFARERSLDSIIPGTDGLRLIETIPAMN